jgi:AcrR family transcriptional regulator
MTKRMTQESSPNQSRKKRSQDQILKAATKLFSAYGFRHTTMEGIAQEAQVAKATAYAYFPNKEEAFAAVIKHVGLDFIERAEAAAVRATTPEGAVLASLSTKQLAMYALVNSSPHATELLEAIARNPSDAYDSVHTRYVSSLAKLLRRCPTVGPRQVKSIALLLDHAAHGLSARTGGAAELKTFLGLLVERVVGPATKKPTSKSIKLASG